MTTPTFRKASLLAIAVSAALAACGGGGGGDSTPAATTTAPTNTTTGTTTTGQTLVANVGTTNSPTNNTNTSNPVVGSTAPNPVPAANQVVPATLPLTSSYTGEGVPLFNSINDWRNQMRTVTAGSPLGVGVLARTAALDDLLSDLRTSQPNLFSLTATPTERAAAIAATQALMTTTLGYQTAYVLSGQTNSEPLQVSPGNYCAKTLFSTLPGVEMLTSGVRDVGVAVTDTSSRCVVLAGISNNNLWQLPPADSTSVYPFPGKQLTLPNYYGDWAALNFATQPGHAVLASVASSEALPVPVSGAGTGASVGVAIPTSQITVQEFSMRISGGAAVPVRIFTQAGVIAGSGVTLNTTTQLLFPTSIMAVPEQPLQGATVYSVTFRATVRGRPVSRTWEFTTA